MKYKEHEFGVESPEGILLENSEDYLEEMNELLRERNEARELLKASENSHCADPSGSRTDTERLDWIERKQLSGEFLHDAIHWDGRVFRECIDEAIDEENTK